MPQNRINFFVSGDTLKKNLSGFLSNPSIDKRSVPTKEDVRPAANPIIKLKNLLEGSNAGSGNVSSSALAREKDRQNK